MARHLPCAAAVLLASVPAGVRAQAVGTCPDTARDCQSDVVAVSAAGCDDLIGFELDSGWLPSGKPIQVRFVARLGGLLDDEGHAADVEQVGELASYWPEDLHAVLVDREEGGRVRVGYGLEVEVQIRYDFEYAGVTVSGTTDIPVPFVTDALRGFRTRAEKSFRSFSSESVTVEGTTDRRTLFDYDVLDPFFDLPFGLDVSGGFRLDVRGFAEARYEPGELAIREAETPAVEPGEDVRIRAADDTGYGANHALTLRGDGELGCDVGITFLPTLYISIASADASVDFPIDLAIDGDSTDVSFTAEPALVELPDIVLDREVLDLGEYRSGTTAEKTLFVDNRGDRDLDVLVGPLASAITASPSSFTVRPGSREVVTVAGDVTGLPPDRAGLVVDSSDPDRPSIAVGLLGEPITPDTGAPGGEAPGEEAGGVPGGDAGPGGAGYAPPPGVKGGCAVASPSTRDGRPLPWLAFAVAVGVVLRRWRI